MTVVWDFTEARTACRDASKAQQTVEDDIRRAYRDFAEKEEAYRKALAVEIVKAHNDGIAWTTAPDIARGDALVARLRRERDIAEGVKEATLQAAWRRVADRKDAQRFSDWSMRRELAEGYSPPDSPATETFGGRRAA